MSSDYTLVPKEGKTKKQEAAPKQQYVAYPSRWFMLGLFSVTSMTNALQWLQFAIIGNLTTEYYGVSYTEIEWTSMLYMVTYIALAIPAAIAMDKLGLRKSLMFGAGLMTAGAWLKAFATGREQFWLAFAGHAMVASAQPFIASIPPRLAAVWFPAHQVSSACSTGVFGNQMEKFPNSSWRKDAIINWLQDHNIPFAVGIAVGFLLPSLVVERHDDIADMGHDLSLLFYGSAILSTVCAVLVLTLFKEQPPTPPSVTQADKNSAAVTLSFGQSLSTLFTNQGYICLFASYGIIVGMFYSISTVLNQIILYYFPEGAKFAGEVGLVMVVTGMLGSFLSGIMLDKTHKFKETTLGLCIMSLVGMSVFTYILNWQSKTVVYITSGLIGFFMTGYLPVGFEFAAELTYPEPETTSAGLLIMATMLFATGFTSAHSWLMGRAGVLWANLTACATMAVGVAFTAVIRSDLRRLGAQRAAAAATSEC